MSLADSVSVQKFRFLVARLSFPFPQNLRAWNTLKSMFNEKDYHDYSLGSGTHGRFEPQISLRFIQFFLIK